ncbi:putative f-box and wd40 domain protein [Venturia nashicola]|uniref:Putative f-box and wd40 domain protein n=1 Tax=Venturia nashicola TaxID=86259 RepID=A0A4Z1P748_9PEZI|nr:putative f-box and wd40 domain protein [Venturia nashicola]TLD36639.1 putative f-box and wd40 domain protein [Venturia nashicola]
MVQSLWHRPQTSSGLVTLNNHSSDVRTSIHTHSDSRRATQEFLSCPTFGDPLIRSFTTDREDPHDRNVQRKSLLRRLEGAKSFARKVFSSSGDMSPVPELTSTDSGLNVGATNSHHAQSSHPQSTPSGRSRLSRIKSITRSSTRRRNAISLSHPLARSGKIPVQDSGLPAQTFLDDRPETTQNSRLQPQMRGAGGASARASAAATRETSAFTATTMSNAEHILQTQSLQSRMSRTNSSRASNNPYRTPILPRNDTMVITRSRQHASPDMGQRGYDEITQCEPILHMEKVASDPIKKLPTEISAHILSYLDVASLLRAMQVSKGWKDIATSNAVWRSTFFLHYSRRLSNPQPYIQMGGAGLGCPSTTQQPWQLMAEARYQLERSWRKSQPKAVYFSGHTDSVYCCQFDEDKIITGSRDRTVRVWDLNYPYKCRKVIGGPAARPVLPVSEAALSTHSTTISNLPSVNGTAEGNAIFHIPQDYHSASILCLQFDSHIMVTGSSDSTCIVWNIHTFQPIYRLRHHSAGVLDVCFDETFIISCSKDATICVWNRHTGELITVLAGHKGPVNAVQLRKIKGVKLLVSASGDGYSKLWDLRRFEEIRKFESQDRGLAAVEFSDDGRYVLAGGNDQVIYKYDVNTQKVVKEFKGHTNLVRSLYLDSANARVLSGSYDQAIRVFDFETGNEIGLYEDWTTSWILAAKSDYRRIVATSQDGRALLMDFGHGIDNIDLLDSGYGT